VYISVDQPVAILDVGGSGGVAGRFRVSRTGVVRPIIAEAIDAECAPRPTLEDAGMTVVNIPLPRADH
jgi:hypothetical protein